MKIKISFYEGKPRRNHNWQKELKNIITQYQKRFSEKSDEKLYLKILFLDGSISDIEKIIQKKRKNFHLVILVVNALKDVLEYLENDLVDDVIVAPLRIIDVFSKLNLYKKIFYLNDLKELNQNLTQIVSKLDSDLQKLSKFQKEKIQKRFRNIKEFWISSRYLSGIKSGGDYLSLTEEKDQKSFSIFISNVSRYGLSSVILETLANKIESSAEENSEGILHLVRSIYNQLSLYLKEQDEVSIFYGIVLRETKEMVFINIGNFAAFYIDQDLKCEPLLSSSIALSKNQALDCARVDKIKLSSGSRLLVLSQGFIQSQENDAQLLAFINQWKNKPAVDLLNEFAFQVKSKLNGEEMPAQDCTAIVIDVNSQILKLTTIKQEQDES